MTAPFRFIHAADLHLDSPFRGLAKAPEQVREQLMAATISALRQLTETAIREQVDFVVLSGDLFDEADRSLKAQLQLVREWERLEEQRIAVFVIHGNHDPLNGTRADLKLPANVHVFGAEQMAHRPAYRRSGELAAFVYGRSYGRRTVTENWAASYRIQPEGPFHIALLHANVDGDGSHDPYAPCTLVELAGAKGFDYWALGHIHSRRVLHEYPHVVYAGNTQGRNPRETGAKGCYIVDVTAARAVELTFVPLDAVRWLDHKLEIDKAETEQALLQQMIEVSERYAAEADGRSIMLRFELIGRGPLHQSLSDKAVVKTLLEQLQEVLQLEGETWIYVHRLEVNTSAMIHWQELTAENSFAGELARLSERLGLDDAAWRDFASAAVGPIAAHAKLGRLMRDELNELPVRWLEQARELTLGLIHETDMES
ncbi:metallophosphoesterase family protein [Paenibacillus sp. sgz302251]|uniref:metallophosphoesterase family protein n=1 Tax=Paenibacillus sp. sgz302251 TaxID=3414493 RepID=UPI003C7BB941